LLEATVVDVDLSLLVRPILRAGDRMIEWFLTHPTFLNCPDELALSILKQACRQDRVRAVELLLQRFDENVNLVIADSPSQDSLLAIAVECGSERVIDFIVSHPKFDVVSADTMSILWHSLGSSTAFECAIKLPGIDINACSADGSTPLTALVHFYSSTLFTKPDGQNIFQRDLATQLKFPGIDVNQPDKRGRFMLTELIKGQVALPSFLTAVEGLDWNVRDMETLDTPLILMARQGRVDLPSSILERQEVDVNAQNREGNTAAIEALKAGSLAEFAMIAARVDCRLDIANNTGETVFSLSGCQASPDAPRSQIIDAVIATFKQPVASHRPFGEGFAKGRKVSVSPRLVTLGFP
jgi:hypothetical protein